MRDMSEFEDRQIEYAEDARLRDLHDLDECGGPDHCNYTHSRFTEAHFSVVDETDAEDESEGTPSVGVLRPTSVSDPFALQEGVAWYG